MFDALGDPTRRELVLGDGTRFLGDLDATSAALERTRMGDGEGVTHIRFRVVR